MITDEQRIGHILAAIARIRETACGKEEFLQSVLEQDAVSYNFLIIGEAAGRVSEKVRDSHPEIPWRVMAGMRNVLIHDYVQTDYSLVWETIQKDLPPLQPLLRQLQSELKMK